MKFYICEHCGNIITHAKNSGVPVFCCGQKMKEIIPGSVEHPMAEEHFIEWLALETEKGSQIKKLVPGEKPEVVFALAEGEKPLAVYAWCNLHGLWKTEL